MIDVIGKIHTAPIQDLKDKRFLLEMIRAYGLHNDPNIQKKYPAEDQLYLKIQGMIQIPDQLAETLLFLSDREIRKYIEVGTFNGMTTNIICTYLNRFTPIEEAISIDNLRPYDSICPVKIKSHLGTSDDYMKYKSDLCFIDGDHSFEWVEKDYNNIGRYSRYCMFHDIIEEESISNKKMDVKEFWGKNKRPTSKEFTYGGHFGIGIL